MPTRAKRPCTEPGCPALTATGRCPKHKRQPQREYDRRRRTAAQRGYDGRWQKYRATYLAQHPFCAYCTQAGKRTPATVVDHIEPHKGDHAKFWNPRNHQPLCAPCHNGTKKRQEMSGTARGCDENGVPLDPKHHWRR